MNEYSKKKIIRLCFRAGNGMSPSSSKDKIGACCIRSYFPRPERACDASADRLVTLS